MSRLLIPLVAIILSAGVVAFADETSEKAPTVDEIVASLKAKEEAIETLQVTCLYLGKFNFDILRPMLVEGVQLLDHATGVKRKADESWEVTRDGCGRMEAVIETITYSRADGTEIAHNTKVVSTFNGVRGRHVTRRIAADGSEAPGRAQLSRRFTRIHTSPFDMATQHDGTPISTFLTDGQAKLFGMEQWEDRPVVVVELLPVTVREDYIYQHRIWVDVDRSTTVRRQTFVQCGEGKPWGLQYQVDATKFLEASPGIWLPTVVDVLNYSVTKIGPDFLVSDEHMEAADWRVNEKIDPSRFSPHASDPGEDQLPEPNRR